MKRRLISFIRTVALCSLLATQTIPVFAQEDLHPAPSETIRLKVGDIFEILPIHDIADATYTWILTQDRTFLEANRAPSFRKRLIQPGMYTLYAEIASADGARRISRTISLDYSARQPGESTASATNSNDAILVQTEPAADEQGRIALAAGTQLVELIPVNPDITPLALDLDLSKDADGDGKPENDIQADGTFFHSDATPLFLWITNDPLTTHSITVTAATSVGARTQKIDILNSDIAKAQGIVKSPVRIEAEPTGERTYIFNPVFENPDAAVGQLLYQWQFGDGQQSLITKPEHTYTEDGTYSVSLLIRNLRDGSDVASTSIALNVTPKNIDTSSSEESSQTSEPTTPTKNVGIGIGTILLGASLFILSLLLGIGIIFLFGKLRKNKTTLADKLENIEKTMVKSPAQETPNLTIAPPSVTQENKIQEPPAAIAEREKELVVKPPAPQPVAKQENAPAWLTAGTPKASEPPVSTTPTTPQPASAVVTATPRPTAPAPTQTAKTTPAPAAQAPAWLQTPAAATPVTPQNTDPVATEQKATAPAAPAWLQSNATPQSAKPSQSPAPQSTKPVSAQTPKPVTPPDWVAPAKPKPQPQTPVKPAVPAVPSTQMAPRATPPTPQQKPRLAATPVVPFDPATLPKPVPQPATPSSPTPVAAPAAPQSPRQETPPAVLTQNPATPVEMDIPPAADQPIAIIRAESLNPPDSPASA